jgi:hypothetical protein
MSCRKVQILKKAGVCETGTGGSGRRIVVEELEWFLNEARNAAILEPKTDILLSSERIGLRLLRLGHASRFAQTLWLWPPAIRIIVEGPRFSGLPDVGRALILRRQKQIVRCRL